MSKTFTQPAWLEIEVSGNSGSAVIPITDFVINHISVKAPSSSHEYDITIRSHDGYLMAQSSGISGDFARETNFSMYKNGTVLLTNATDGTYYVQITRENIFG